MALKLLSRSGKKGVERQQAPWQVVPRLSALLACWSMTYCYGAAAALIFPKVFFVNLDPTTATLLSLLSFELALSRVPSAIIITLRRAAKAVCCLPYI